jgi:hypothetical protein
MGIFLSFLGGIIRTQVLGGGKNEPLHLPSFFATLIELGHPAGFIPDVTMGGR